MAISTLVHQRHLKDNTIVKLNTPRRHAKRVWQPFFAGMTILKGPVLFGLVCAFMDSARDETKP
jgi:hypothetical protein